MAFIDATKKKTKTGSTAKSTPNSGSVTDLTREQVIGAVNKWKAAGILNTPKSTAPAARTQQPVASKPMSVSPNSKAVGSFIGTGSLYGLKAPPKLEFSVLPGTQPGPIMVPSTTAQSTPSTVSGETNISDKALGGFANAMTGIGKFTGITNEQGTALSPSGVALNIGMAGLGGPLLKTAFKGAGTVGSKVANLFGKGSKGITAAEDAAKLARYGRVEPPSLKPPSWLNQPWKQALVSRPIMGALSGLGALVVGGGIANISGINGGGGGMRSAVPSTGTTGQATAPGQQGANGETLPQVDGTQRQTAGDTAAQFSALSTPVQADAGVSGYSSTLSGGGGGSLSGGANGAGGVAGSTALRGESLTQQQAAAQARAQELQRQQGAAQGVATTPIGEQVDLAKLQQNRDTARKLLDQYGADAVSMPEFKTAINSMISAGIQNLRNLQPTPPEPVVETPEQAAATAGAPFDVVQNTDNFRRQIGLPALESQKADLQRQMTAVNQVYEKVIDQIKENPNLPKGLAARRLTEVFQDQKYALSSIMSELEIVNDQIKSGNDQVNSYMQQLGLQLQFNEAQANQESKQYQRRMDQIGLMIESRAIGGMTDQEIRQWSAATGISVGALNKMRSNALDVENEKSVEFQKDGNGNLMMITYDKKNPLNRNVERIGSVPTSGGGMDMGDAGGLTDLDLLANTVLGTGSVAAQKRDFATYEALKNQDPNKAQEWLYGKVASGLSATQKNDFRIFGSVVDGSESALAMIDKFAKANPGVYASIYNSAAPYLTASRNQDYVKLMQKVTSIGNEYRNAIFGASLTGNEQTEGLKVVIGNNDDLPTIVSKLQGLSDYSQTIRQRIILDAAGQVNTSLSQGGPGTIQTNASNVADDNFFNSITGTQTGGDTGYWGNLWNGTKSFIGSIFGQ